MLSFCIYTVGLSSQVAIYRCTLDGSSILNGQNCCLSFYRSSLCQTTSWPDTRGWSKLDNIHQMKMIYFPQWSPESTGELEGNLACVSVNMDLLNFQNIKKLSLKLNTGLPASAACEWLIAVDELYSPWKSAAAQTQQEVCRLMLKRWTQVK